MAKKQIKLSEAKLRKIVAESVRKVLKEQGQPISYEQAGQLLMSYIEQPGFGDKVYEFAQNLCDQAINDIESKYTIVGADGTPYTDEEDVMWYDDYRDDFMKAVFEKVASGEFN